MLLTLTGGYVVISALSIYGEGQWGVSVGLQGLTGGTDLLSADIKIYLVGNEG